MSGISRKEALRRLAATLTDVDVAVALVHAMQDYAAVCDVRGYRIPPAVLRNYAARIVEELCATKEQDDGNAQL
ncbi:MAG: hypothetical protein V3S55_07725 [Nitrospiraceae bacterium]